MSAPEKKPFYKKWPFRAITGGVILAGFGFFIWFILVFYHTTPFSHTIFNLKFNTGNRLDFLTGRFSYTLGDEVSGEANMSPPGACEFAWYPIDSAVSFPSPEEVDVTEKISQGHASIDGVNWDKTFNFRPQKPGWYVIRMGGEKNAVYRSIVVHPDTGQITNKIAYIFPTNTWQAYNYWGGQSIYTRNATDVVSTNRPLEATDPYLKRTLVNYPIYYQSISRDRIVLKFLDSLGLGYDLYSDEDFHQSGDWMKKYKAVVIGNHSEYWSENMFDHLESYLESGGSFICLSGNTAFWNTEFLPGTGKMQVIREEWNSWIDKEGEKTGLLGTHTHLMSFHTYAPYEVKADTSWLLAGTGLKNGDLFGEKSSTYDNSISYLGIHGLWSYLLGQEKYGAASGHEIDRTNAFTPANWVTVAAGKNAEGIFNGEVYPDPALDWDGRGGAELGWYRHPAGGIVFNASSISFTGAIPYDPKIRILLTNLFTRVTASPSEKDPSLILPP
ncbi:MAG: hypothetical protein H6581_07815 [Bacteroidia bacterium]|nr:hypothetical protein [Bacteroidia bacterium]